MNFLRTMAATQGGCLTLVSTLVLTLVTLPAITGQWTPSLTSTESTVTLQFQTESDATLYIILWHQTRGFFFNETPFDAPFSGNQITYVAQDLSPGRSFTFVVFKNGNATENRVYKQDIATVPLPPENVNVVERTTNSLLIEWDPAVYSNQTSFEIEYQDAGGFETVDTNSTDLQYNLTGLSPGHTYLITIRAVVSLPDIIAPVRSNNSVPATAVTVPGKPAQLQVTAVNSTALLASWEGSNNSRQDSFQVSYAIAEQTTQTNTSCTSSPCTFAVDGPAGQLYTVLVYAVKQGIVSEPAQINHNSAPIAPTQLMGEGGIRSLRLMWEMPAGSLYTSFLLSLTNTFKGDNKSYNVSRKGDNTTYTFTATSLVGGVGYFVSIYTLTATEPSIDSASHLFYTLLEPVRGLSGKAFNTTALQLAWQNPINSEYRGLVLNVTSTTTGSVSSYNLGPQDTQFMAVGLEPGEEYFVVMVVQSDVSNSQPTNNTFRTKPEAPQLESVESTEDSLVIVLKGGVNGIYDSIMAQLSGAGPELAADGEGKVTFTGLTAGTEYILTAYTTSGSQNSDNLVMTLYTKPRPVPSLDVIVVSSTQLDVQWEAPVVGGVDNYTLTLVASHGAEAPFVIMVNGLSYAFTTAHPGETYNVSITANKGDQSSLPVLQQNTTSPLPLMHVRVSLKGTDFVTIAWDVPSGTVYDGFAYDFPYLNATLVPLPATPTSQKFESLAPNTNYTITLYVFSTHVDGTVLYSEPTSFNFSTYPESVATLQKVDATEDSITVNWTAPVAGEFTSYILGHKLARVNDSYVIRNVPKISTNYTFEGLKAGEDYSVAIRTVLGPRNYGIPVYLEAVTKPLPVVNLMVTEQTDVSLTIAWMTDVNSTQDRFTVRQEKDGIVKTQQVAAIQGQTSYSFRLEQLLSGFSYNISVAAVREIETDIEESGAVMINATTNPLPVTNLTVTAGAQLLTLTWAPGPGSRQEQYRVRFRPVLRDPDTPWLEQTAVTPTSQIPSAFPGEQYMVSVYAVSNEQISEARNTSVVVAPLAPNITNVLEQTTTTSVTLTWAYDPQVTFVEYWTVNHFRGSTLESVNITRTNDLSYSAVLTSLTPGATYTVEAVAVVQGVTSLKVTQNVTAKPMINTNIQELSESTTETQVAFEYSVRTIDVFDYYQFSLLESPEAGVMKKEKLDPVHQVTFTGLLGGQLYTVSAVTVSKDQVSDAVTHKILTVPNNVEVTFEPVSNSMVVHFVSIVGSATKYRVTCQMLDGSSCGEQEVPAETESVTVSNLQAFTNYTFTVVTVATGDVFEKSASKVYSVRTAEAAPTAVRNVKAMANGLRTVQLTWDPPLALNGQLQRYEVVYVGQHGGDQHKLDIPKQTPPTQTDLTLDELKAGYEYTFMRRRLLWAMLKAWPTGVSDTQRVNLSVLQVSAVTVAAGEPGRVNLVLPTDAPAFSAGMSADLAKPALPPSPSTGETTLSVELVNPFTDYNGPILSYTVIVSRQANEDLSANPQLPSWSDAQSDGSIIAYQTIGNCSNLFTESSDCDRSTSRSRRATGDPVDKVIFRVGLQSKGECSGVRYCNGPLTPATDYYVKLRAYTASGYTDTAYSSKIRTAETATSSAGIIGGIVAVVVALVIVAVIAVIIVRRKRRPRRATKYRGNGAGTHTHTRHSWEHPSSLKNFSRPVKVSEFPEHVRRMAADSDFKYAEEYEDLKEVGRDQTCYAAELPVNRPKNRFTNILPYDHSRVKLLPTDDEEGSDYINANYMPGYSSKREYIATQGPLPATRDDFWRMLWEQNSRNIVMLTRCMEKGREKSDHYWPSDSEPKFYGDLQVVVLNETHLPDWTITEFRISLGDNSRHVRHFHYKAWPDFGVPKNHSSLIRFVKTVRDKLIKEGGPIITHCSAGVGRSGTFIVLDHVLQLVKEKDEVDIFGIVYSLRRERVLMVQTEPFRPRIETAEYMTLQQYKFIHECLACVLEGREDEATYANIGQVNVGFEDDEGINVEVS